MDNSNFNAISLITSYLSKEIDAEDFVKLQHWISESQENEKLFIEYATLYKKSRQLGLQKIIDKDRVWKKLGLRLINFKEIETGRPEKKIFKLNFDFYKYAAAAAVLFIAGYYFYAARTDSSVTTLSRTSKSAAIEPGTDKATLVLGDGRTIALGEGNNYTGEGVAADSRKVVYSATADEISTNYLTIPRAGQFLLQLADGTKVWLNSESKIKFPNKFTEGDTRIVELVYGEAYFEVSPSTAHRGSHFKVKTKGQIVEVLGTQFNIKAYEDEHYICTTLVEGKVRLSNGLQTVEMIANQQTVLNLASKTLQTKSVDVYNDTAWKEGIFSFEKKSLKQISQILSRWYDVDVVFSNPALENKGFNGLFEKNQGLTEILETFKKLGAISKYSIQDKRVIIQ